MTLGILDQFVFAAALVGLYLARRVLWRWLQRFLTRVGL